MVGILRNLVLLSAPTLAIGAVLQFKSVPVPSAYKADKKFAAVDRRHDWCDVAQRATANGRSYEDVLNDRNISVAFLVKMSSPNGTNYVSWDHQDLTGGFLVEVWDEAAKRTGLRWKNSFAMIDVPSRRLNESYDSLYQWAVSHYDVVVDFATLSPTRSRAKLRFLYPVVDTSFILVGIVKVSQPPWYATMFSFLQPFTPSVWCAIVVSFCVNAIVYRLVERTKDDFPEEILRTGKSHAHALFLAIKSCFDTGTFCPETCLGKILTVGYNFGLLLLTAAYTANLASLLVVQPVPDTAIKNFEEALSNNLPLCFKETSFTYEELSEKYQNLNAVVHDEFDEEYFESILNGSCVAGVITPSFWDFLKNRPTLNKDCQIGRIGDIIERQQASFVTRADSGVNRCTDVVSDILTLTLQEMALDDFLSDTYTRQILKTARENCKADDDESEASALGLADVSGIFVVQAFSILVALLGYVFFLLCQKKRTAYGLAVDSEGSKASSEEGLSSS